MANKKKKKMPEWELLDYMGDSTVKNPERYEEYRNFVK